MKTNRYQIILAAMAMSVLLTGCQFGKKEKKDPQPKEDAGQVEEMSKDTDQKKDSADSEKDEYFDQLYGHIWAQAKRAKEDQPDKDKKGEEDEEKKETEPLPDDPEAQKREDQMEKSDEEETEDSSEEDDLSLDDLDQALSGLFDKEEEPKDEEGFAQVNIGENEERKDLMIAGKDGKTKKRTIHFIHIDKTVNEEETTEIVLTEGRKDAELYFYTNGTDEENLNHFATAKLDPSSMSFTIKETGDQEKNEVADVFQKKIPKLLSAVKHYLSQSDLSMTLKDLHFGTEENQ